MAYYSNTKYIATKAKYHLHTLNAAYKTCSCKHNGSIFYKMSRRI